MRGDVQVSVKATDGSFQVVVVHCPLYFPHGFLRSAVFVRRPARKKCVSAMLPVSGCATLSKAMARNWDGKLHLREHGWSRTYDLRKPEEWAYDETIEPALLIWRPFSKLNKKLSFGIAFEVGNALIFLVCFFVALPGVIHTAHVNTHLGR